MKDGSLVLSSKTIVLGGTGSGKTIKLMNYYQSLIQQGVCPSQILVLVRNRKQSRQWKEHYSFTPRRQRILSYFGFVQGEVKKYWPMLQPMIPNLEIRRIEPKFMTIESSQFLMGKIVEESRKKGQLLEIHATQEQIALEMIQNLSRAIMNHINIEKIGEILYRTHSAWEQMNPQQFQEVREICSRYWETCLSKGLLDYGMTMDLYHRYLMNSPLYQEHFALQNRHVIVDDLEEAVPREIELIQALLKTVDSAQMAFNQDGPLTRSTGACPELVQEKLFPDCQLEILGECYTASRELVQLGEAIMDSKPLEIGAFNRISSIQRDLRSEMLQEIGQAVERLVDEGVSPGELAIIAPRVDPVLTYCLENQLKKKNIPMHNLARTRRRMDEPYGKALIVLSCLAHPQWNLYPSPEDLCATFAMMLDVDPIRSSLLVTEIIRKKPYELPGRGELSSQLQHRVGEQPMKKFSFLKKWLDEYQQLEPLPLDGFFQRLFTDILMLLRETEQHLNICRQLMDSCSSFLEVLYCLGEKEPNKAYVEMVQQGMRSAETLLEIEQRQELQGIIVATPFAYLSYGYQRKVQIWIDIGSEAWSMRDVKELTNPHVFSPLWDQNRCWLEADGERYRQDKLNTLIKRLTKRCGEQLITAQSLFCSNGYELDGLLAHKIGGLRRVMKVGGEI